MDYTGRLLIAHPKLKDNFFERSVIYVYEHSEKAGTVGLVLNKSTSHFTKELFVQKGFDYNGMDPLYQGGPVNTKAVIMLHTDEWFSGNTMPTGELSVSSDTFMIEKVATGNTPEKWRLFLGMSVWAPGQLEAEIAGKQPYKLENRWLTAQATPNIVFDFDGEEQWNRAVELSSQEMIDYYF